MTTHRLEPTADTTVDVFTAERPPVLSMVPGDTLVVGSLDASGYLVAQTVPGEKQPTMFADARGHCLTGPITVTGAQPGDVLVVHLKELVPGPWGWTVAGAQATPISERLGVVDQPSWLLWELDAAAGSGSCNVGVGRDLAPFLGVMGVAPAATGEHSTIPPRAVGGGNIDCKELVAGSTLYLPVAVPGAMLSLGDGHAAQGDGEVGGTAIECPMTTTLSVDLVAAGDRPLEQIHAETPAGRVTFGFDADLNVAMGDALDAMVRWMQMIYEVDKSTALAMASVAVDMRVTQVANQTWGVHALLPTGVLS